MQMPTAEDVERPNCECHGEPMVRNGNWRGVQRWTCAGARRQRSRDDYYLRGGRGRAAALYRERQNAGVCVRCARPRLTESLCWDCLDEMESRYACR